MWVCAIIVDCEFYLRIFFTNNHNYMYIHVRAIIATCKLVFHAGVKGMSERSELTPCIYTVYIHVHVLA